MRLTILLYALSILLKRAPEKFAPIKKRVIGKNITIQIRTRDGKRIRSFTFSKGKVFSTLSQNRNNTKTPDAALVFHNYQKAFKTLTSGYDGDFMRDLDSGDLVIEGDAGLVFWFSSTLREIKDIRGK